MPPGLNGSQNGDSEYLLEFEKPLAANRRHIVELEADQAGTGRDHSGEIRHLRAQYLTQLKKTYSNLSAWQTVQVARHPHRPLAGDYIERIVKDFVELHGDRTFGDDGAIRCGMGRISAEKVAIIAQHKGRDTNEKIKCNFGCAHPEGYRKALRVMKLAEKFSLPIVTLIDTPGAYPGVDSEERGVAEAIAVNLREMSRLRTPIVCLVIGEGGSGGALAIGVADHILMLENSIYSVISPEGCAAILWRDGAKSKEAAKNMKLTAKDAQNLGVLDLIISEPVGGAHRDHEGMSLEIKRVLHDTLAELEDIPIDDLLDQRLQKFLDIGIFEESGKS